MVADTTTIIAGDAGCLTRTVFASVALGMIAVQVGFTAGPLAAAEIDGAPTWSGAMLVSTVMRWPQPPALDAAIIKLRSTGGRGETSQEV